MNEFLSKENTVNIFKSITSTNNLINLNKQQKDNLINKIISIMKSVYKTLELQKINKTNLLIVKKQYNDIVIKQTSEYYKENNNQAKINNERQTERMFSVKKPVPVPGADRPTSFKSSAGNTLGNAPPSMSADFMKKATDDINTRLAEIETSRRATQERPKPTELPDFLKPQKVGKSNNIEMPSNKPIESKPLLGFNDVMDSNFSSSVPSSDKSKYTEQLSTMDRLKQLEAERNMTPHTPVQNTRSDYNNLNTMFNNNESNNINTMFSPMQNVKQEFNQQQYQSQPPPPQQYQSQPQQSISKDMNQQIQEMLMKMNEMQQTIIMLKQENDYLNNEKSNNNYMNQKKTFTEQLQLEISKKDSRYNYQFNQINNITNIRLTSYQLPPALYNILDDTRIIYKLSNDIEKQIIIPKGNYNINNLLMKLNENDDLIFITNIEEKIIIKSKDNEKPFQLIHNIFTNKLGFNDNNNVALTLVADRIYDIRHLNKLYLYIRNIYQDKPVGILNFNGSSIINLVFNNISLSNLLLEFYTEDNQLYNFNNINYSLSFIIETNNQ